MASPRRSVPERSRAWPAWFSGWEPFRAMAQWEPLRELVESEHMRVDEYIENNELVIRAEIPGIDPQKDIDITITDDVLEIRAERREEKETEGKHYRRSEIHFGSFSRSLPLPKGADADAVKANYTDGILTVSVPIREQESSQATRIPITRGD